MQEALSQDRILTVVKQLEFQFGAYRSVENITVSKTANAGIDTLKALCQFSDKSGDLTATIDNEGKIIGFFIKPHTSFTEPSYARHDRFTEQEIEIPSAHLRLKGTLSLPQSDAPVPCVVLVHGSGPCDRDETVGSIKVFRDLAWGLASNGIAVLRYEKRSRQFPNEPINTVNDETVDDAIAAVEFLKTQSAVDQTKLIVLGHSLGALMIPRIAQREKKLAGLIICAGPTRKLEDIVVYQIAYIDSVNGVASGSENLQRAKAQAQIIRTLGEKDNAAESKLLLGIKPSWWLDIKDYDPIKTANATDQPLLIIQGERDYQVTLEDFKGWQKGMKDRQHVSLKCYPGLAHTFTSAFDKPGPGDYDKPQNVSSEVIEDLSAWIKGLTPSTPPAP